MKILRLGLRLLIFQVFFIILIWLAGYFAYLDLILAVVYLGLIGVIGARLGAVFSPAPSVSIYGSILLIGLLAQFPGWLCAIGSYWFYAGFSQGEMDICRFGLALWHTPFLSILASLNLPLYAGLAVYYLFLFLLSPLYAALLLLGYAGANLLKKFSSA